jgi:hypothetical protein
MGRVGAKIPIRGRAARIVQFQMGSDLQDNGQTHLRHCRHCFGGKAGSIDFAISANAAGGLQNHENEITTAKARWRRFYNMCFNRLKFHNANCQACCFTVPNRTVSKASYGYDWQARKNFSGAPKMRQTNLRENTNGQHGRGMNRAGLAVM